MMIDAIKRLPPIPGVGGVESTRPTTAPTPAKSGTTPSFDAELQKTMAGSTAVSFSAHATSRLMSRQIQLTDPQRARLEHGVAQAAQKGAKESLVMVDNLAFIVSVPNRTVVTAVDGANRNGNVFTQIDSAVIV
jgi:flagellar operon protein